MPVGLLSHASRSWDPLAWRALPAVQQPTWPDPGQVRQVTAVLAARPPLVTADEVDALRGALAAAALGRAFVVQAGDCAETFEGPSLADIAAKVTLISDVARKISTASGLPVVRIGRIAGQYAKPRTSPTEHVAGRELPSFRGYLVNSPEPLPGSRAPDPRRLLHGHQHAHATMRLLRTLGRSQVRHPDGGRPGEPAVWTSHEALVLDYEEPLTRRDPRTGAWLLTSTHLPWIGMRTNAPAGAHVGFLSGVANPVGCKIGPAVTPADVVGLCRRLDPGQTPGRLVLICRMGADRVAQSLPPLVTAVAEAGHPVVWMCDPMHGNTRLTSDGRKTRQLGAIVAELRQFFAAVRGCGGWPGGVHLEATADDVTECLGGRPPVTERDLGRRYTTVCDPRLNRQQAHEVASGVAELCAAGRKEPAPEPKAQERKTR